ncbi:MAG: fliS [Acidimicrobiaceae bacterium]|jgi:flagellar protein FliS|nr:fliS [Acidimicrobiaceae bacterium]
MTSEDQDAAASLQRYLANQINTATPAQRLVMLLDQLRRDLHCAQLAFEVGDFKEISDNLVHAQHIIFGLRDPLDLSTELGRALSGVYGFCAQRLLDANLRKDASLLPSVQDIVDRLTDANRKALAALAAPSMPSEPAHAY